MSNHAAIVVTALLVATLTVASDTETSTKFDAYTYCERANNVSVLVSSRLAFISREETHLPFQIAIGVHDKKTELIITRASFVLIDDEGNVHPMAAFKDVDHTLVSGITRSDEAWPINTPTEYVNMEEVLIDFYPEGMLAATEAFKLTRRCYFEDVIYFPQPDTQLEGVLTLQFVARGLPEPMRVRFRVPQEKGKRGAQSKSSQ